MSVERQSGIGDVLALLLLAYVHVCVFFGVGLFLGLNPTLGAAALMSNLETLISLPLGPVTGVALVAFNQWSLEVYVVVAAWLLVLLIAYPFRKRLLGGLANLPTFETPLPLRLLLGLVVLFLAFLFLVWIAKFPDISPATTRVVVLSLGAMLLLGVIWLMVPAFRGRSVIDSTFQAFVAVWVLMLLPLQIGIGEGVRFHLRPPGEKVEMANGATILGRTVVAVPVGVVFAEYKGPGPRYVNLLGGQQIITISGLTKAELEKVWPEGQSVPVLNRKDMLCEFLESWTRRITAFCGATKVAGAMTMSPDGQLVWLPMTDKRTAHALSLESYQASHEIKDGDGAPP